MKVYTINQGSHNSVLLPSYNSGVTRQEKMVRFNNSAIYKLTQEDCIKDINKLYGMSYSLFSPHINSVRFGWRCINGDSPFPEIEIFAYMYLNRARISKKLGVVYPDQLYRFLIDYTPSRQVVQFRVINDLTGVMFEKFFTYTATVANGTYLFPYFGGNCAAPQKITIEMD